MTTKQIHPGKDLAPSTHESVPKAWIAWTAILGVTLLGGLAIAGGTWRALNLSHDDGANTSAAMDVLLDTGSDLQAEIKRTIRPAMDRTEILARSPDLIRALASGDRASQTALLNSKITTATEIDAIALFNSAGRIAAINTCYADGKPIPKERVARVLGEDFKGRRIIQSCLRNTASTPLLEFQTHCDITPAFFDSTGLSVAYSVPVINPRDGTKLGVISSRLRFDRLSGLIEDRPIGGGSARAYFVTDSGGYFSEAINGGREQPPVPVAELRDLVRFTLNDAASKSVTSRADKYLAVFSLPGVQVLDGGGIHILIVADGRWLTRGPRQERLVQAAAAGLIGLLLLIVGGLIHGRLAARRTRRTIEQASEANARLAAIVEASNEAIVSFSLDGTIRSWNRGAEQIFGYTLGEIIGRGAAVLEPPDRPGEAAELRRRLLDGGSVDNFETRSLRKDGRQIDISLSLSIHSGSSGEIVGISGIAHNITAQKRAELELREAHNQLEIRVGERTRELSETVAALQRQITERMQVEESLKKANESAEAANHARSIVFDTALDAIVTIDARGVITAWNLQAETMFRWDRSEAIGMRLDQTIVSESHWDVHRRAIDTFLKTGDGPLLDKTVEIVARRRDGREFPVEVAITPAWSGGECTFTAFIRDITVRKQAEADLRQARDAAETASRAKSEFLANMSHEIRTPLNGVIGMSDLLLGTTLDQGQKRFTHLIKSSGESLLYLIDDILDFSKIEARKMDIESVDFDLHALVESVTEMMSLKAADKVLDLACLTMPDVPRYVKGDPQRVKQVLVNLVNNAIKFTESGSVITRVALDGQSLQHATVQFAVTDTGVGIAADRMDRLFKSFSQVDSSTTRTYGGTGLGLAISKQLAELMGGSVGVESTVGSGSTFWFTVRLGLGNESVVEALPAASEGRKAPATTTPGECHPQSPAVRFTQGGRVLVAEDNRINQIVAREVLARHGYVCDVVDNGKKAVAAVAAGGFDLVLMDCSMPEMDGFEATRQIRWAEAGSEGRRRHTPIIALTANAINGDRERCLQAGMDDYVSKPIDANRLIEVIQTLLAKSGEATADQPAPGAAAIPTVTSAPPTAPAADNAPPVSVESLLERCMGDAATVGLILDEFERQAAADLTEITRLASSGDCAGTARVAHALKGASGILSAGALTDIAYKLEQMGRAGAIADPGTLLTQLNDEVRRCVDYLPAARAEIAKRTGA